MRFCSRQFADCSNRTQARHALGDQFGALLSRDFGIVLFDHFNRGTAVLGDQGQRDTDLDSSANVRVT